VKNFKSHLAFFSPAFTQTHRSLLGHVGDISLFFFVGYPPAFWLLKEYSLSLFPLFPPDEVSPGLPLIPCLLPSLSEDETPLFFFFFIYCNLPISPQKAGRQHSFFVPLFSFRTVIRFPRWFFLISIYSLSNRILHNNFLPSQYMSQFPFYPGCPSFKPLPIWIVDEDYQFFLLVAVPSSLHPEEFPSHSRSGLLALPYSLVVCLVLKESTLYSTRPSPPFSPKNLSSIEKYLCEARLHRVSDRSPIRRFSCDSAPEIFPRGAPHFPLVRPCGSSQTS